MGNDDGTAAVAVMLAFMIVGLLAYCGSVGAFILVAMVVAAVAYVALLARDGYF